MMFWQKLLANPATIDRHAATELELYIDNDGRFSPYYSISVGGVPKNRRLGRNVAETMAKRIDNGTYDPEAAVKGWMYVVDAAAKAYAKEFGGTWYQSFDAPTRRYVAREMAERFVQRYRAGEVRP